MRRGKSVSVWAAGVLGWSLALSPALVACGSGDSHRQAKGCPEDCPEELCEQATGECRSPDTEPPNESGGGAGGQAGEPAESDAGTSGSGGVPDEPPEPGDTQGPTVILSAPEEGAVVGPDVVFDFEADEPSTYTCTLNDSPLEECEPGMTAQGLDSGLNTFSVMATDTDGNESEVVNVSFFVNYGPEISGLEDIEIPEDTSSGPLTFNVEDHDSAPQMLIVGAELDSVSPIGPSGLLLGGSDTLRAGVQRTITLTPLPNAFGPAVLTVSASDGYATTTKEVQVRVTPVNDAPTIDDVPDKRVAEREVLGPITFHVDDIETPAGDLIVTARTSDASKVPLANIVLGGSGAERTFTVTPIEQQSGPVTITLSVSDGELTASDSFVLTLGSTDDEPAISTIADQTTPEDTPKTVAFTVSDPDTSVGTLTPSASFAAAGIVKSVTFGGSGASRTFTITPKANQTGTAPVTISISDASGGVSSSFLFTVTPVNDPPSLTPPANRRVDEDSSTGVVPFSVADIDSANVSVTAASSNTALIPNTNIVVTPASGAPGGRNITVTPVANASGGPVTITLTANDGALTAQGTFTVTVASVNDPPSISAIADRSIDEDSSTGALPFSVTDLDSGNVSITATSSNTTLIPNANVVVSPAAGAPGNRTVTVTPVANASGGPVAITLTASDGALTSQRVFNVTVLPVNDPPTISNIADRTVEPDTSTGNVAFTVGDPDGDSPLGVSASSADQRVAPNANITLGGSGANRTIAVLPGASQGGSATITVTVNDGNGGTATDTFVLSAKVKVAASVVGNGSVTASGTGCPGGTTSCAALPGAGTVTFVATPKPGSTFVSWSGACSGTGNGVVSPIPSASVNCTATFRNLWARLFYSPDDAVKQQAVSAQGVIETPKSLHYLASLQLGRATSTTLVWNADPATGAVTANSAFSLLLDDGSVVPPRALAADSANANGSAALVYPAARRGSGLIWFNDANQIAGSLSYESDNKNVENVPYALVRSKAGVAFTETSNDASQSGFPTFAQLVRVDAAGNVLGATAYREAYGDCQKPAVVQQTQTPTQLAINADGSYLIASTVPALTGEAGELNLTLIDADGTPVWGRHVAPERDALIMPAGITANGDNFLVTGIVDDGNGSYDAFILLITKAGDAKWWQTFGSPGVIDATLRGVPAGTGFVVTGYTAEAGTLDLFAVNVRIDGALVRGLLYGGDRGSEQGIYIAAASAGGYNLFGGSINSFGNTLASSWALRVDPALQITLQTGTVTAYQPALTSESIANVTPTCLTDGTFAKTTATSHALGIVPTATSVGGAYQTDP